MKNDDDFITEDAINDLIQYSEDDDDTELDEEPEYAQSGGKSADEEYPIEFKPKKPTRAYDNGGGYYGGSKKKNSKIGAVICIIAAVIAIAVFIGVDSGIIGNYKSNFANNFSKVFSNFKSDGTQIPEQTPVPDAYYNTAVESGVTVSFESAGETEYAPYKDGIICVQMNHMSYFDESGALVWETDTAIVDPILKAEGGYIMLAENGGNKICLYNDRKLVYDVDDPDIIMSANVSENGDVVAVASKASYKGGISVYNRTGAQIFSWASGSDSVISADISASSRRVAVSLLNTDTAAKTTIQLFDINETESYEKIDVDNTVIFNIEFTDNIANCFGDNRILGISTSGKIVYDNTFSAVQLTHSAIDENGNKLLAFDDANIPMISIYNKKGVLKESAELMGVTNFVDINGKKILYNIDRDVYFGKINSDDATKYSAAMDIKNLIIISENSFVIVYSNSIEFVTV
ncbi:MAG: DUF5711 family protein [Oscillospiraceae bacterium]|nr:DUF5711 family protein [Oscillospiraceae bacterium]